jgi:hypothetical protein
MIILISENTATFLCRYGYIQHKIILKTSETPLILGTNSRRRSLLSSSSVRLSLCVTTAPNGRVYATFDITDCYECQTTNLVETGQKYVSLHLIIRVRFIVAVDNIRHNNARFE